MSNAFKVVYNVKHIDKKSALYGIVSFDQSCKFASMQEAMRFVKCMRGRRTNKIEVVGMPVIERVTV